MLPVSKKKRQSRDGSSNRVEGRTSNFEGRIPIREYQYTGHMAILDEPTPIQIDESCVYEELEDKATLRTHSSVFKLSQPFGASFTGCKMIVLTMFLVD